MQYVNIDVMTYILKRAKTIFTLKMRRIGFICFLCVLLITPWILSATSLKWDAAGGAGSLGGLNIGSADSPSSSSGYSSGEYYNKDGFLGRFVYKGPANELEFKNIGPAASGGSNNFYYTKTNATDRWRRYFFVASIHAYTHNGTEKRNIGNANTIIENLNDKIILVIGAGAEEYDTSESTYSGGYNNQGVFGTGPTYKYVYPYKYYWIDLTVIRTNNSQNLGWAWGNPANGAYESQVSITGNGISMALNLVGYRGSASSSLDSYSFSVDRACPDSIPFEELLHSRNPASSYLVGNLRYQSVDTKARVKLASAPTGGVDFKFESGSYNFPYTVGFKSTNPAGGLIPITATHNTFPTTSNKVEISSPMDEFAGEKQNQFVLNGEIRIWVDSSLTKYSKPPESYSSTIYCILTALQ